MPFCSRPDRHGKYKGQNGRFVVLRTLAPSRLLCSLCPYLSPLHRHVSFYITVVFPERNTEMGLL